MEVPELLNVLALVNSPANLRRLRQELRAQRDLDLTAAPTLAEGLELLAVRPFDAALLDLNLPDSRGPETFHRLHAAFPRLPVVVTGGEGHAAVRQLLRGGAQDYVSDQPAQRPGMGTQLARALRFAVDRHQARVALEEYAGRLRQSQADLHRVIEASSDAMIIVDGAGHVRFTNPAASVMFGRTAEELMDAPFGFPTSAGETTELDVLRADGSTGNAEMRVVNLVWEGEPALLASLRDITRHKKAQEEMETANALLEQRVQERTAEMEAFSYTVSHDLRAPLRHIRGFAQMLEERVRPQLDEESLDLLNRIGQSVERMQALILGLLEFSRLGRAPVHVRRVDVRAMLETLSEEFRQDLGGRNVEWRIGSLPEVQADPVLLRSVLTNLVSNALKFTRGRDPARIEISGCRNGSLATITVRDNGVGFDMAIAGKLFGVFQRLHLAREFEGTGIGLANVRRIVQKHGGRVWAEAAPGGGAAFSFTLGSA